MGRNRAGDPGRSAGDHANGAQLEIVMATTKVRFATFGFCALVCVACPISIAWFGYHYGYDRLERDDDFKVWRVYAVELLFWFSFAATGGLLVSARRWWWLAALIALPLLILTGVLSISCSMWLDGTYF